MKHGGTAPRTGRLQLRKRSCSRGAALLAAMLTVTLVATFAASALWQQWRGIEVETAERARVQSAWILIGALDWSRLILIEDYNAGGAGGADHLAEPWAVPLEEARLSTFLAADRNVVQQDDAGSDTSDAFLSGQVTDLQSRLNLATLVNGSADTQLAQAQFARLFTRLGLAPAELDMLVAALRQAQPDSEGQDQAGARPSGGTGMGSNSNAPLMPQTLEQLTWLGVQPATVAALAPYATLLPDPATRLNINTADATVLMAAIEGLDEAGANKLVAVRQMQHFRTLEEARALLGSSASAQLSESLLDTRSSYFEVRGRLRLRDVTVHERSLVHRIGRNVTTVQRERGAAVLASAAPGALPP